MLGDRPLLKKPTLPRFKVLFWPITVQSLVLLQLSKDVRTLNLFIYLLIHHLNFQAIPILFRA